MIAIIKSAFGNTGSIKNMLKKIGYESVITSSPEELTLADKLILPGVGSFDHGMEALHVANLVHVLNDLVLTQKKPVLGICLGMQLMTLSSEEGTSNGLGWIDAMTKKIIPKQQEHKIPHMGWNEVQVVKKSPLAMNFQHHFRYYFVHSYHVCCNNESDVLMKTEYINPFVSAFQKDNIYGVQFHPEKSHKYGMKLMKNFVEEV